jgi:signal transduction histidine kinase
MNVNTISQNELLNVIIYTFIAFCLMGLVVLLFFYFSNNKLVKQQIDKKNLEIDYQKQLIAAVIITQEEERKRIAQDLHDDISSKLNIVSLNGHMLKTPDLTVDEQEEITTNIINFTKRALDNSRRIAHDLLPPVFEKFGLDAGIKELVLEYNSARTANVTYQSSIQFDFLQSDKHLHIFRILQELLNNSLKHGKATSISIVFEKKKGINVCKYADDGVGFDMNDCNNQKGLGMKNIESRVNFVNGTLEVYSEINKGIKVNFNF